MFYRFACAIALSVSFAAPALAQMSSYERGKVESAFNAPAVQQDPTIFDGTTFVAGVDKNAAYKYMNGFIRGTNNAVSAVNGLSSASRTSDEGQALAEQANEMLAYSKALRAAYQNFDAAAASTESDPSAPSGDGLTDAQRAPVAGPLDALDALMAQGVFDGTEIDMTVTTAEADTFADAFIDNANAAAKALNRMSGTDRRTPGGKELFARVNQRLKDARALNKALNVHAEARRDFEAATEKTVVEETPATAPVPEAPATAEAAPASTGDPATLAAIDAFDALMADGRYDGKAFQKDVPIDDAHAFQKEVIEASRVVKAAFEASGDETLRARAVDTLKRADKLQGAIFNHRVVRQRIEGAERKAQAAAERAARDAERKAAAEAAAAEETRLAAEAAAVKGARANAAESCQAFASEVMTSRNKRRLRKLFDITISGQNATQPEVLKALSAAEQVAPLCKTPTYADAIAAGCSDEPERNPTYWCETTTNAKSILAKTVTRWGAMPDFIFPDLDKLEENDGWWAVPLGADFEAALAFSRVPDMNYGENTPETFAAMNAALGISEEDYFAYDSVTRRSQDIRELIEDEAGNWPESRIADPGADQAYITDVAAQQILKSHTESKVLQSWIERSEWKIHKNDLGVILRRTLPGNVLIETPGDPFCQMRSFIAREQYTGGSQFQKAKSVTFGYTRFQNCDRR